ncbi:putative methyltransferase DDB_G0268948 [Diadema antillarum]|uniref:putative methyltransferase DDB_G0268948 n=1 Tax=Diadema antillarum TaxID=105358 RepID=UPI003A89AAB2
MCENTHYERVFEGDALAKNYALYRPGIPDRVTDTVLQLADVKLKGSHPTLVVDVGCGSGQFTRSLARHFDRVLGCDVSQAQIDEAKRQNQQSHVDYCVSPAEALPVEDSTVDVITASSAAHWFEYPTFFQEVDRVLRPGGCVVVLATVRKTLHHQDAATEERLFECKDKYMKALNEYRLIPRDTLVKFYEDLRFPSYEMKRDAIGEDLNFTASDYVNFMKTVSYSLKYREKHPESKLFEELKDSLHSILVSGEERSKDDSSPSFRLTWWYDVIIARKPETKS